MMYVFDDSGGYKQTDFISIAGYVASDEKWGTFSDEWLALLRHHKIPYVHMRTLVPLQGPYKNLRWDVVHRNEVLLEFVELIKKHVLAGFAIALDAKHFRKLPNDADKVIGNPHHFCVARLLRLIRETLATVRMDEANTLVFDDSDEFSVPYHGIVRELRKQPEYKKIIGSVCFADDEIYNPLQAADVLAWESTKDLAQQLGGFASRPEYIELIGVNDPELHLPYISELYGLAALDDAYKKCKLAPSP